MNPCIVYLAQNTDTDIQYGRDSKSMLKKSLNLLYLNYNDDFKHDILIFHEGDFDVESQEEIRQGRSEIKFHQVILKLPTFLDSSGIPDKWDGIFGIGYRHMIRFFAISIFPILKKMGYDWYLRLDDDSFIHSKIGYDLFDYMITNGFEYGYRVEFKEPEKAAFGFSKSVLEYIKKEKLEALQFRDNFDYSRNLNYEYFNPRGRFKQQLVKKSDIVKHWLKRDLVRWKASREWNRKSIYTNFHISKISLWLEPEVQSFLNYIDRSAGIYKHRWGDAIIHTAVLQLFIPKEKVFKFTDWTYEHATIKGNKLDWGGIYPGIGDENNPAIKEFKSRFGKLTEGL